MRVAAQEVGAVETSPSNMMVNAMSFRGRNRDKFLEVVDGNGKSSGGFEMGAEEA